MNEKILKLFTRSNYIGEIQHPDIELNIQDNQTANKAKIYLKLENNKIKIRYKILGSSIAMALLVVISDIIDSQPPELANKITLKNISNQLGNPDKSRIPCIKHFLTEIKNAIKKLEKK